MTSSLSGVDRLQGQIEKKKRRRKELRIKSYQNDQFNQVRTPFSAFIICNWDCLNLKKPCRSRFLVQDNVNLMQVQLNRKPPWNKSITGANSNVTKLFLITN